MRSPFGPGNRLRATGSSTTPTPPSSCAAWCARQPRNASQPLADRGAHGVEVALQPVVALHLDHVAVRRGRRHAERVAGPLHDERRDVDGVELLEAALLGL